MHSTPHQKPLDETSTAVAARPLKHLFCASVLLYIFKDVVLRTEIRSCCARRVLLS